MRAWASRGEQQREDVGGSASLEGRTVIPLSLALAAASALALNWGFFAQHSESAKLPRLAPRHPLRSLRLLFTARRWLAGFLVGIGGWALYAAALAFGPLSIVQATSAGGIGILALLVWRLAGVSLARREWLGVALAVFGLALLGLSLLGRGGNRHHWGTHGSANAVPIAAGMALFHGPLPGGVLGALRVLAFAC
jgi:drug/metabolite transporter (DMT)-like permease